jgi:hypothetical protein
MIKSLLSLALIIFAFNAHADIRELIDEDVLKQIAEETSGEAAKRNLDTITLHRNYGLEDVELLEYPADGKTMFGTQKSRPVWDVRSAELWEMADGKRVRRLGDWDSVPLTLAQDSLSGEATTTLVDIGAGTLSADYAGKEISGKLVLTSSQPENVVERAVGELGAAGIISYAPNQRSAWWKEDDRLVRWGHLDSFPETESFGFMISLGEARSLQARLASGEEIQLYARVDASHQSGSYGFATAAIRGTAKADEDIHFTCHLDHPRPGANDNASGCVSILETARTLNALVKEGILPRPARTIRFLWPAEIEGSIMYLVRHPDVTRIKANIHMDMVGGGPVTKSIFRISGGPISVPSFIADLGHEIGHFMNEQTEAFTSGSTVDFPLNAPEGGKEPLMALMEGLDMGSDWPDRYIHTNYDLAANIDPTKLKRAAFIGAVSAWFLANMSDDDVPAVMTLLERNALARTADLLERRSHLDAMDDIVVTDVHFTVERRKVHSVEPFANLSEEAHEGAMQYIDGLARLVAVPQVAGVFTKEIRASRGRWAPSAIPTCRTNYRRSNTRNSGCGVTRDCGAAAGSMFTKR